MIAISKTITIRRKISLRSKNTCLVASCTTNNATITKSGKCNNAKKTTNSLILARSTINSPNENKTKTKELMGN